MTARQDQRTQFRTDDGTMILMRYDAAVIRGDEQFARTLIAAAIPAGRARSAAGGAIIATFTSSQS